MGQYQEALTDFDSAILLDETSALNIASRGETYRKMQRYREALIDFNYTVSLDEELDWAIPRRGETYRQMGRYREALTNFNRVISLNSEEDSYWYCRALVYLLVGQTSDFKRDMHTAIKFAQATK